MWEELIVGAARATLLAEGYRGFSVQAVAARAGVEPGSIGRGDVDLLVDVLADGLAPPPVSDLGNSANELRLMIEALANRYAHRRRFQAALLGLTADRVDDPEAARLLAERCTARSRANLAVVLRRAVERGDLPPDADLNLLHDIVVGSIAYRQVVAGRDETSAFAQQIVDMVLRGMAPLREAPPSADWPVQRDRPWWLDEVSSWFEDFGFGSLRPLGDAPASELAAVPSETVVDGHRITIEADVWRNFELSTDPDGSRLIVAVKVVPVGTGALPPLLRADRVAVVHTDEVWVAPLVEEALQFRTSRRLEVVARRGPKWEPETPADVVVHLEGDHAERYPIRVAGCVIGSPS
ncbi:TetR/AcrR family transcriptional regulator C-terminal ligand-binding domain-containing protein [Actinoplanes sp. NPDC049599]|uniref:TetR/AcrR family transcriptional regulator n=1 Tax=Actinoplanes sp. NPDC049599 TaxID=3363903 RepID=UPI0037992F36